MGFSRQEYWSGVPLPSPQSQCISYLLPFNKILWNLVKRQWISIISHSFCGSGIQEQFSYVILAQNHRGTKTGCMSPKNHVFFFFNYWRIKKAEHWRIDAVVLEKTLESPLDCKEIKPINHKGNQSWIFTGRTEAEPESPILWPPDVKNWLTGKDSHAGKDRGQEEKGVTQDEMVGWHHRLNGHELERTPADSEGQGSLVCCSPWGRKELNTTEWLKNTQHSWFSLLCWFLLYSKVNQLYIDVCPLSFRIFSRIGHHRALSTVPCAMVGLH